MALEPVPAAERGATRIADKVIAKIAVQAAHEALRGPDDTAGTGRPVPAAPDGGAPEAHVPPGGPAAAPAELPAPGSRARDASVSSRSRSRRAGEPDTARLRVSVELGYPSDIGAQCRAVRRRVVVRVRELAGFAVREVAVDVERLNTPHLGGDRAGRVQ
ncbi:Asp23/Gls24 family envelope stress response protein [Streptomyces chumphonensis]|uniref:Asp23/Gls24 family envelope stress response protein n=1 Tax=Streptomyces chumphonensis TaxID=1214925 RepID=A0A927EV98_9ACTN|nr:Asp23/Gls24 family envelope stress response protein [Streptomyces chumphonensis]MBD3930018.1 Asp23/Gls24 family envelope stress response protein [Streptomyces chumphonensis]